LGVAIKCDDGASRAAEMVAVALIARFASLQNAERDSFAPFLQPPMRNWNGIIVGAMRPSEHLLD
jgi:L-asparaginase II